MTGAQPTKAVAAERLAILTRHAILRHPNGRLDPRQQARSKLRNLAPRAGRLQTANAFVALVVRTAACSFRTSARSAPRRDASPRRDVRGEDTVASEFDDVVTTTSGRVRGVRDGDLLAFRGVPYGADTSGLTREDQDPGVSDLPQQRS
jgi:hypothetical protein